MAEHTTLKSLFTAIADAIRGKDGSTSQIVADDFPYRIAAIETQNTEIEDGLLNGTLETYTNDRIKTIAKYSFYESMLKRASFANVTKVLSYAFCGSQSLAFVDLPSVLILESNAFADCSSLTGVNIRRCAVIYSGCFSGCGLKVIDIAGYEETSEGKIEVGLIVSDAFNHCDSLVALVIRNPYGGEKLTSLSDRDAFLATPIEKGSGYIYVPRALIEEYKAAVNWSTYATQFRALEDYTVDGTITGDLDESKI